jgi:ribosomal protein S18 acetylase RimI-like enzyme
MRITIRPMTLDDLDFACALAKSVGWVSQDRVVFEIFVGHDPNGCFVALADGQAVGIITATFYGESGYLGTLIVDEQHRGQGIGRTLLMHGVDYLQRRGAQSIFLDGAPKAVSLYERCGFSRICPTLRFDGDILPKPHPHVQRMTNADLTSVFTMDRMAFGADRSYFLKKRFEKWSDACLVYHDGATLHGFITGRHYDGGIAIGPWITDETLSDPLCVLQAVAASTGETALHLSVLEINTAAVKLLRDAGFSERDDLHWRMVYGKRGTLGQSTRCYAVGALAKG